MNFEPEIRLIRDIFKAFSKRFLRVVVGVNPPEVHRSVHTTEKILTRFKTRGEVLDLNQEKTNLLNQTKPIYTNMKYDIATIRSLGSLVPYSREKTEQFLREITADLEDSADLVATVLDEVEITVFEGMTVTQLLDAMVLAAASNIQNNIEFDKVATRLKLMSIYDEALEIRSSDRSFAKAYQRNFINYIKRGINEELLDPKMESLFDLEKISEALVPERDDVYKLIGLTTARNRYMRLDWEQNSMETPQYLWMRVGMWIAHEDDDPTKRAIQFYNSLSKQEYISGGSTNIGSGTLYPTLSNCFLLDTQDDTNSIFDNVKNIALISKATGGIGISVTKLRASGSTVHSNNVKSTGPIPFINVMDAALRSMSRGGKKYGAVAIYMENWHYNFPEFLDLRQNAGDDYRRIRTANTAVYISDEFMKRVVNGKDWYMFDPYETPELTELYGAEFSKKYNEYIEKAENGEMELWNKVPAREQMKSILTSLLSTSHPWLTWKDNINTRALNNNTGTIHCSNLCTEITLPQDADNIAVCNLAYVNLVNHVDEVGQQALADLPDESVEERMNRLIDFDRLAQTAKTVTRHLDNLVTINMHVVPEAKKSDSENRAVGLGLSGFSETLEHFGYAYDSEEAFELMDRVMEFISYNSIEESTELAKERGSYKNFKGSLWSKGMVPVDTVEKLGEDRIGSEFGVEGSEADGSDNSEVSNVNSDKSDISSLSEIKEKIQKGIKNASTEESKELYEIFEQLAGLMGEGQEAVRDERRETGSEELSTVQTEGDINYLEAGKGTTLTQNRDTYMNWDKLRKKVKKGMRNATLMAIAPNASTGLVLGTTPGLDPRFAQLFSRQTSNGKFLDINHNLVKALKAHGLWEQVRDRVIESFGDIQGIEEIPEEIKAVYKTSFQISPYAYIEVASRAQKWIDQSISRNMYLATRDTDEMIDIYTEAWRRGVKTTYYLHSKPRHQSEQSSIKVNKAEKIQKSGFGAKVDANSSSPMTQQSLDGKTEKKGFGFVKPAPTADPVADPLPPAEKEEEVAVSAGSGGSASFGFGAASKAHRKKTVKEDTASSSLKNNADILTNNEGKSYDIGHACPIDPAERADCEACQ